MEVEGGKREGGSEKILDALLKLVGENRWDHGGAFSSLIAITSMSDTFLSLMSLVTKPSQPFVKAVATWSASTSLMPTVHRPKSGGLFGDMLVNGRKERVEAIQYNPLKTLVEVCESVLDGVDQAFLQCDGGYDGGDSALINQFKDCVHCSAVIGMLFHKVDDQSRVEEDLAKSTYPLSDFTHGLRPLIE